MNSLKKNYTVLIIVILLDVGAIGAYYTLYGRIINLNREIASTTTAIQSFERKEETFASLKTIVKDTEDERAKLESYFVANDDTASFIEKVEGLAHSKGLEFTVASISAAAGTLNLQIEATGMWSDLMNFYTLLERMPYQTSFGDAKFTYAKPLWKGDFSLSVATQN